MGQRVVEFPRPRLPNPLDPGHGQTNWESLPAKSSLKVADPSLFPPASISGDFKLIGTNIWGTTAPKECKLSNTDQLVESLSDQAKDFLRQNNLSSTGAQDILLRLIETFARIARNQKPAPAPTFKPKRYWETGKRKDQTPIDFIKEVFHDFPSELRQDDIRQADFKLYRAFHNYCYHKAIDPDSILPRGRQTVRSRPRSRTAIGQRI